MILKDLNHLRIHLDKEKNENAKKGLIQEIQAGDQIQNLPKILIRIFYKDLNFFGNHPIYRLWRT